MSRGLDHKCQPIDPQIPHSKAKYVLAFLYVTYLALYGSQQPPLDTSLEEHSNEEAKPAIPSTEKEKAKQVVKVEKEAAKPLPPVSGSASGSQQQLMGRIGPLTA